MSSTNAAKQASPEEEHEENPVAEAKAKPKKKEEAKNGSNLKVIEGGKKGKKKEEHEVNAKKPELKVVKKEEKHEAKHEAKHEEHGGHSKGVLGSVGESALNGIKTVGRYSGITAISRYIGRAALGVLDAAWTVTGGAFITGPARKIGEEVKGGWKLRKERVLKAKAEIAEEDHIGKVGPIVEAGRDLVVDTLFGIPKTLLKLRGRVFRKITEGIRKGVNAVFPFLGKKKHGEKKKDGEGENHEAEHKEAA